MPLELEGVINSAPEVAETEAKCCIVARITPKRHICSGVQADSQMIFMLEALTRDGNFSPFRFTQFPRLH